MSEHSLPPDMADWPDDDNALLGVTFGVSPRDLRRAYNRLIRIYKPEQFPEQFRRIREAYEHLLRIAELFGSHAEISVESPADTPQILPAPQESPAETDAVEWTAGSPRPVEETQAEDDLDELWQQAIDGKPQAAYELLAQLTQQYAGRTELYLRLYWLRALFPDVDARRVPADWLVQGLLATGLSGSLRELYREEIVNDPTEALAERYERLLDTAGAADLLADLIEGRFQAAVRLQRWRILADDVRRFRGRFGLGQEEQWVRLLFGLCNELAWAVEDEALALFETCRAEIGRLEHFAHKISFLFDRFDLLVSASAGWRDLHRLSRVPVPLLRLLADSSSRPFAEVRAPLMEILDWITATPGVWLDHLDEMHKHAPVTLSLFGDLLDRFEQSQQQESERGEEDGPIGLAKAFLAQFLTDYQKERNRLLLFCIRESIAPEKIAEAASDDWANVLRADWPLRYVCQACRLFWA
jgi:hypothetical protein